MEEYLCVSEEKKWASSIQMPDSCRGPGQMLTSVYPLHYFFYYYAIIIIIIILYIIIIIIIIIINFIFRFFKTVRMIHHKVVANFSCLFPL